MRKFSIPSAVLSEIFI